MDEKEFFRQGLARMREKADGSYGRITIGEILSCFPGAELTKEQIRLIYQYAEEEHIVIEDYKLHDTRSVTVGEPKLTGDEKKYFNMYLEDLKAVVPCRPDEEAMLAERLLSGDDSAIARLTEGNLRLVLDIAQTYTGQGVLLGDLVQEGNMALMLALGDMAAGTEAFLAGGLREFITARVERALKEIIFEQSGYTKAGEKMARETNRLLAATLELEEELGREATLSELAEKVNLPEEKVKDLIKVSLDAAEFTMSADPDGTGADGQTKV